MDALTPKQLIFLDAISKSLQDLGHDVFKTSRSYHDATYVVSRLGLDVAFVGSHGGASISSKLEASLRRSLDLAKMIEGRTFDLAFSFSSPEAARVAFGLGIPHYTANDSPHAMAVAKLTLPLSKVLFTPALIPPSVWARLGMRAEDLRRYDAVDAAAWIKHPDRWPKPNEAERRAKGSIVVRVEESQASYLLGSNGDTLKTVISLADRFPDKSIVVLARYSGEAKLYSSIGRNVVVCDEPFFGANMLKDATLLVGRGGTMNAEAALLGVPAISYFPGRPTLVDKFLENKGLLELVASDEELLKAAKRLLSEDNMQLKDRGKKLLAQMVDPADFIAKTLDTEAP